MARILETLLETRFMGRNLKFAEAAGGVGIVILFAAHAVTQVPEQQTMQCAAFDAVDKECQMLTSKTDKLTSLRQLMAEYYEENGKGLLFHGWHHISFVQKKSVEFAKSINADLFFVESAALVHDLNYLVEPNSNPEVGKELRQTLLQRAGYDAGEMERIEGIVIEAHTAYRGPNLSPEGQVLSDADSVFKILPITPVVFSGKYISQNRVNLKKLATKITNEQNPLLQSGIYFYTDFARQKYQRWAETNIGLWNQIMECMESEDVQEMLSIAQSIGVI